MATGFLSVHDLHFGHDPGRQVLRGTGFDLAKGATLVVVGPSGCGKTTLLRCIAGLERPMRGEVRLDGRALSAPGTFVRPEQRSIGFVFQGLALFPHLTVRDNVGFGLNGIATEEKRRRVDDELDGVGLLDLAARYPHQLSGGQQQRVAIARALILRPKLMLMDEPFSDLDTRTRAEVRSEVMRILRAHGITTILVTHDREDAWHTADRIAEMDQGRIVREENASVFRAIWSDHPFEA